MRSRAIESILWGLCFTALFFFGWFRGREPEIGWRTLFGSPPPLVILTPDASWLPKDFLQIVAKNTETELHLEIIQDFADFEARLVPLDAPAMIWVPMAWARGLASQGLLLDLSDRPDLADRTDADFQSADVGNTFIPVLWKHEDGELRIEGLALPSTGRDRAAALRVMAKWLSPEIAAELTRKTPAASALEFSNTSDLPFEKRADALRNRPLR